MLRRGSTRARVRAATDGTAETRHLERQLLSVRSPQLLARLAEHPVDAIVLQETKLTDDKFPHAEIEAAGYRAQWFGQRTY